MDCHFASADHFARVRRMVGIRSYRWNLRCACTEFSWTTPHCWSASKRYTRKMTTVATPSSPSDFLSVIESHHTRRQRSVARHRQKEIGQFFTPAPVASFMASLFDSIPPRLCVLDPGAGIGVLSAAVCERVARLRSPREVEIHLYETDKDLLPALHSTMERCQALLRQRGHVLEFAVHPKDFILQGPSSVDSDDLYGSSGEAVFDAVIMNPPYSKIRGASKYARTMSNVVHGQPNLYALFMAAAAGVLKPGGQLVAITPRSFANGPYFRSFRRWFLKRMALTRLHVFESRRDAFEEARVLQENVITVARRQDSPERTILISQSEGKGNLTSLSTISLPTPRVIDDTNGQSIVRMPASGLAVRVMEAVDRWPTRFREFGLRVSTGPVVLFRAAEFVCRGKHVPEAAVPLLSVQNVHPFRILWPATTDRKTWSLIVSDESKHLLVPSANYVLIRRFSAKEEARRLTACPLLKRAFPYAHFALENHLNYIFHAERSLSESEAFGVAAVLNSYTLDVYFRTISGSTQVNAAEIRDLPFPDLDTVDRLGCRAQIADLADPVAVESAVLEALSINGSIRKALLKEIAQVKN